MSDERMDVAEVAARGHCAGLGRAYATMAFAALGEPLDLFAFEWDIPRPACARPSPGGDVGITLAHVTARACEGRRAQLDELAELAQADVAAFAGMYLRLLGESAWGQDDWRVWYGADVALERFPQELTLALHGLEGEVLAAAASHFLRMGGSS